MSVTLGAPTVRSVTSEVVSALVSRERTADSATGVFPDTGASRPVARAAVTDTRRSATPSRDAAPAVETTPRATAARGETITWTYHLQCVLENQEMSFNLDFNQF